MLQADRDVLDRFQKSLQFKTISRTRDDQNYDELAKIITFIKASKTLKIDF